MNKRVYVYWSEGKRGHKIVLSYEKRCRVGIDFINYPDPNWRNWPLSVSPYGNPKSPYGNPNYGGFLHPQYADNISPSNTISIPRYWYPIADFIPALARDDKKSTQVDGRR